MTMRTVVSINCQFMQDIYFLAVMENEVLDNTDTQVVDAITAYDTHACVYACPLLYCVRWGLNLQPKRLTL